MSDSITAEVPKGTESKSWQESLDEGLRSLTPVMEKITRACGGNHPLQNFNNLIEIMNGDQKEIIRAVQNGAVDTRTPQNIAEVSALGIVIEALRKAQDLANFGNGTSTVKHSLDIH